MSKINSEDPETAPRFTSLHKMWLGYRALQIEVMNRGGGGQTSD